MIVTAARKKSTDPVQEALREKKALWNKEVSAFVDDLINLKKMLNGWPSKFHMERAKITEPLPKDPATILGVLAGDFRDIAVRGNEIISQQLAYSQTRRKKKPKQMSLPFPSTPATPTAPPAPTPETPDLSQQLSLPAVAFLEAEQLIAEASNPLTRFLSKFKGPWFGNSPEAKKRRYRLTLLTAALSLFRLCSKFQVEVLRKGKTSIDDSNRMLAEIEDSLLKMTVNLKTYAEDVTGKKTPLKDDKLSPPATTPDPNTPAAPPASPASVSAPATDNRIVEAEAAIQDFSKNLLQIVDANPSLMHKMRSLHSKFSAFSDVNQKLTLVTSIIDTYKNLVIDLGAKRGVSGNTISEIVEKTTKKATAQMNVVAQAFLKKWLGKTRHRSSLLGDETSSSRLIAYESAEDMRDGLERMMNSLEKDFDAEFLSKTLNEVYEAFFKIKEVFGALLPGMILTDPTSLEGPQKKKLQDLIERRRMRQLTERLYGGKK